MSGEHYQLKRSFRAALIISAVVFIISVCSCAIEISKFEALKAEVAYKTSWGSMAQTVAKSAFDGFTLGIFAEEGLFTEHNKATRWVESVVRREAQLQTMIGFWAIVCFISIVSMVVLLWLYIKRHRTVKEEREIS